MRTPRGREPGTANKPKNDLRERLQQRIKQLYGIDNYDPLVALAEIACDPNNPVELRAASHRAIAPYVRPQLKQVELTGVDGGPIETRNLLIEGIVQALERKVDAA